MTSAYLAGPATITGRPASHGGTAFLSGHLIVVVVLIGVAVLILLAIPVLGEYLQGEFSARAKRVAPAVFLLGLGVLLAGLAGKVGALELVGGAMMGSIVLGFLLEHY